MSSSHTIVIGAGIVGVCTAYELARRGHPVTLLDKGGVGAGASFGNAGIIAVGHPPLPRPGLVWKTIKWMLDGGSPLYVPPRLDLDLIRWMWQFRRACTADHFTFCMKVLTDLGVYTKQCFDRIMADERLDCEYHDSGWIEVFLTDAGMQHGLHDATLLERHGLTTRRMSGDELRRQQPAFRDEVHGAIHYADSAFANPFRLLTELADRAARRGATIRTNAEVRQIVIDRNCFVAVELSDGERIGGDHLVLAAGSWTTSLARSIGIEVPMQPGKGYHVELDAPPPLPTVACVLAETYVAATPMSGGLRLAGTVELSGLNHRLVQRRLDMLTQGAQRYLRGIEQARVRSSWCGLRPCTADGLPVIGWAPGMDNVFIATGHAKMGFALAPATGELACQCILGQQPSLDLSPYDPARFAPRSQRRKTPMSRPSAPVHEQTARVAR